MTLVLSQNYQLNGVNRASSTIWAAMNAWKSYRFCVSITGWELLRALVLLTRGKGHIVFDDLAAVFIRDA